MASNLSVALFFAILACTLATPDINVRIAEGFEATSHQFPYQVAIQVATGNISELLADDFCSGSLISPNYVLTAASCLATTSIVTVIMGNAQINEPEPGQVKTVETNFNIPLYYKSSVSPVLEWDIALIKLDTPVELSENIQPIKLADGDDEYAGEVGTTSGWGSAYAGQRTIMPNLRYFESDVLSYNECVNDKNVLAPYVIEGTHICLSAYRQSACRGDYGAPLVVDGVQVGLATMIPDKCYQQIPVIYTRVAKYIDWIKENSDI